MSGAVCRAGGQLTLFNLPHKAFPKLPTVTRLKDGCGAVSPAKCGSHVLDSHSH